MTAFELLQTCRCGACGGPVGRANMMQLRHLARWKHPVGHNVITGDEGRAIAVVCDRCIETLATVVEAVEFRNGAVVYHLLTELVLGPPEPTHRLVRSPEGSKGIECLKCGALSWSEDDVLNLWCGGCETFHESQG